MKQYETTIFQRVIAKYWGKVEEKRHTQSIWPARLNTNSVDTCLFLSFKKCNQYTKEANYFNLCTKIALFKSVSDIIT